VSLYKIGASYFVLDCTHRVSVYRYHGVEWIEAEVTEFRARSSKGRADESPERGEPEVYDMLDPQLRKQRREEMLRKAEQNRMAQALRAARKKRAGSRRKKTRRRWLREWVRA
jgi:hypothetical protein